MTITEEIIIIAAMFAKIILSILPLIPLLVLWQVAVIKVQENQRRTKKQIVMVDPLRKKYR